MASRGHGGLVLRRLLPVAVLLPACAGLSVAGERLGWFSNVTGQWLSAIVGTIALVAIAWAVAVASDRAEVAARRFEQTSARLAVLVGSSPDAVIGLGLDGRIESWNTGAEHVYGYSASLANRPADDDPYRAAGCRVAPSVERRGWWRDRALRV